MGGYNDFFARQESQGAAAAEEADPGVLLPPAEAAPAAAPATPSPYAAAAQAPARKAATKQPAAAPEPARAPARKAATKQPAAAPEPAQAPAAPAAAPQQRSAPSAQAAPATPQQRSKALAVTTDDLTVRTVRRASTSGWRGLVNRFTPFTVGLSQDEIRFEQLWRQARQRIGGTWYVPVIGSGGVTTLTMWLGSTFAELRGEKVLAIDSDPGFGDLVDRAEVERDDERGYTITDILSAPGISTYSDCRAYTVMNVSNLEVLAADTTPGREEFIGEHLAALLGTIAGHYQLVLSDHSRNLRDSVGHVALSNASGLVIVCGTTVNDKKAVDRQIRFLETHGYQHLLDRSVVVLNQLHGHKPRIDITELEDRFAPRFKNIQRLGFDTHLSEGGPVRTDLLASTTRRSLVELAARAGSLIDSKSRGIR